MIRAVGGERAGNGDHRDADLISPAASVHSRIPGTALPRRPRLLDLFCGAGGASMGYHRAGFDVVGIDIVPQPHYPFGFIQADALTRSDWPPSFDVIAASPPCQAYSSLKSKTVKVWPDLIAPVRVLLEAAGVPYIIENVMPAPLRSGVVLCGSMFGLRTHRHRRFETSWLILQPTLHDRLLPRTTTRKRRKDYADGSFISVTGDVGSYVGPTAMGIDWMTGNELSEAIPPPYTEFIGRDLLLHLSTIGRLHPTVCFERGCICA